MKETVKSTESFDLFRIEKSKGEVGISPNTIRKYIREGLNAYKRGKPTFISKSELAAFIKAA